MVSWSAAVLCCPHDDLFLDYWTSDRGHVVRARTQLAQMALRSLTDVHVRLCVSRRRMSYRESRLARPLLQQPF